MQSKKPGKRKFTTQQQQQQQQLLDDFYAELYGGLFEQGTSGFEPEAKGADDDDDDNDDDICALLPDDGPDKEVSEEEEVAANRDIDVQEDEVLTDELPKKQRFMSTGAVCDNNSFETVPQQPPETW